MSLVNLAHVCSHLQNASRARLSTTSIPLTNIHLRLAQQLHKAGFISSVTVAGRQQPPAPSVLGTHPDPIMTYTERIPAHRIPNPKFRVESSKASAAAAESDPSTFNSHALSSSSDASITSTSPTSEPPYLFIPETIRTTSVDESRITKDTVASRRLWLGLKYWDNEPVLAHMHLVSKPTRRIWAGAAAVNQLARGQDWGYVRGCRKIGECLFLTTDRGILEVRECMERGIGGMLLCRVW